MFTRTPTQLSCCCVYSMMFGIFFVLNCFLWAKHSSAAVPFLTLLAMVALWFGVSVPLTFVGAYFGFRKRVRSGVTCATCVASAVQNNCCYPLQHLFLNATIIINVYNLLDGVLQLCVIIM